MLRVVTPLVPLTLTWVNMLVHEMLQLRIQCPNLIAALKTHTVFLLLVLVSSKECVVHTHHFRIGAKRQSLLLPLEQR